MWASLSKFSTTLNQILAFCIASMQNAAVTKRYGTGFNPPCRKPYRARNQMPESSWNGGTGQRFFGSANHLSHVAHPRLVSCSRAGVSSFRAASCRSRICIAKPDDAWLAMWQCNSHTPGLSALNAMTTYPPSGSKTTSRRGGLSFLGLIGFTVVFCVDCCSRAKSWPWRWIYRFGWGQWHKVNQVDFSWLTGWAARMSNRPLFLESGEASIISQIHPSA